jgi:sortase A
MSTAEPAVVPSFLPRPALREPGSLGSLLGLSLRRPGGQRSLSALGALLCVAAVAMFAVPAVTDLIGQTKQLQVSSQFNNPRFKTVYRNHRVVVGAGLTKLIIDNSRVNVNVLVVQGVTVSALRAGAGHYPSTPYPCGPTGNVGIAGHRTTYGRPFNRINDMRPGDTVRLVTPISRCEYRVVPAFAGHSNPWIVSPNAVSVVSDETVPTTGQWLTLTSCNPPGSATQRIVLRLVMISCHGSTCHQQKGTT